MVNRIHLQHLELDRLPLFHRVPGILNVGNPELGHGDEPFDVASQVHHHALVHEPQHPAPQLRADRVRLTDAQPRILLRLLQAQRNAFVLGVHVQDQHLDLIALLHHFGGMLHPLGPRHVRDVDQAVDAGLDLHERAERGEVAHFPLDPHADGVLLRQRHPGVFLGLLHAERDLLFGLVHLQHHRFDRLADRHDLRGVSHVARPAHLGDMDQPLDPRLELDERSIVRDRHHFALHARAHRVLGGDVLPGVRLQLLQAEADALTLPVDVEDFDFDLLPDVDHLGRVRHAAVAHVGDVEQAVHAAQVDEGAEVGDVFDDALPRLADLQLLHEDVALGLALGFEQHAAAHHDVAAPLVQLDDLEFEALSQQLVDVGHTPQRDLAAGEERVHPHQVHHHSALDLFHERARHGLVLLVGFADPLPDPHEVGLLLREDHRTFLILEMLEENLDLVPFLERARVLELVDRHGAFRLEPDVENDGGVGHAQHLRLDDLAFFYVGERSLVQLRHLRDFVRRILLVQVGADVSDFDSGRFSVSTSIQDTGSVAGLDHGPVGTSPGLRNTRRQT